MQPRLPTVPFDMIQVEVSREQPAVLRGCAEQLPSFPKLRDSSEHESTALRDLIISFS